MSLVLGSIWQLASRFSSRKIQSSVEAWFLQMGQRLQTLLAKEQGDITSKHAEFEVQVALHFRVLPLGKVLYI